MAFNSQKLENTSINNGNEFENGNILNSSTINTMINGILYNNETAEKMIKVFSIMPNVTIKKTVVSRTSAISMDGIYTAIGKLTILANSTNKTISNLRVENITVGINVTTTYDDNGNISFTCTYSKANASVSFNIMYDVTPLQAFENSDDIV